MRWIGLIAFAIAAVLAGPATASPDLRYGPAADWVQRLPVPPASPNPGGSLQVLLQDRQVSFHQGQTDYYDENVYKVLNAQGLQDLGTLGVVWDPAFADMTINTAQIIRGDQTIDLLAAGHDFRILQRETGLPEATLDGRLTAIEEIHDLRVGDVVVFATSMHARSRLDNALAEDAMVLAHSGVAARIRYRAIWPKTMNIQWRNTKGIDGLHSVDHGDTSELIYDAHEVTRPHPPSGAPGRFTNLGDIELSAYKSWNDISSLFACSYVGLGLNNEALDAFDAAYAQNTNNASNWGCATAQITDIVSSLSPTVRSAFDASLDARPASPMARLIKGLVLTKQDYQLALLQFNEAVRLGPDWTEARFQRSAANLNLRNYPAALTDLNWLAEKRPTDRRVYTLRGEVYSGQKNHQLAIDDYTKAISLGGATSAVYSNRCRDRAEIKADLQAALEDCDQAVKLAPTIWSSYDSRGLTYLQLGKPAEALADYDASINLNANTAPSHYGRALAKHALGDEAGAKADAEVAFRINRNIASEFATYGLAM